MAPVRGVPVVPDEARAVIQVLPHRQVREQPAVLEHVADASQVARDPGPGGGVGQYLAIDHDPAPVGLLQPGDQVEYGRLARTRGPEQGGDARARLEADVDIEFPAPVADVDLQRHRDALPLRTRRASHSETTSATSEIAMDTAVRRSAGASPPGTWV